MSRTSPKTLRCLPSPSNLDDSALGRFRTSLGASHTTLDFDRLQYHNRRSSISSESSRSSFGSLAFSDEDTEDDDKGSNVCVVRKHHSSSTDLQIANKVLVSSLSGLTVKAQKYDSSAKDFGGYNQARPPIFEHRFVYDADIGPAPFTKPHFISLSRSSPFSGPHTIIEIPFGPDIGSFMHLPRSLSVDEIKVAELAIFALWSAHRYYHGLATKSQTIETKLIPLRFSPVTNSHSFGPPGALYPLTESISPPFPGPRTCIYNSGNYLTGWLLHIPRFLTKHEIAIASLNLRDAANRPFGWGYEHDPEGQLAVQRSEDEEAELTCFLKQQSRAATFLRDVVGLDFAAQDEASTEP